jgi:O-antigen/teichoic acid export membrane protein
MKILLKKIKDKIGNISYVTQGSAWIFFGKGSSLLASLAIMLIFANFLPKETYGAYKYVLSFFAIASLATMPGINTALIRAVARGDESTFFVGEKEKLRWSFLGILFLFIIGAYYVFKGNFILGGSFFVSSVFLPFQRLVEMFPYVWQGRKDFKIQNILESISYIVPAIFLVGALLTTKNLPIIITTYFASYTFIRGIMYLYTRKTIKKSPVDNASLLFGRHLTFIQILMRIASQVDKVILWHFAGPIAVATFSFAQMPVQQLREFIPIQQLALPKLSTRNVSGMRKTLMPKFWIMMTIMIPVVVALILIAPAVYNIIFPAYYESVKYFQVLLLGILLIPFSLLNTVFLTELKKKELYIIRIIAPLIKIVLYAILTPTIGIWGIVYAILAGQFLDAGLVYYFFMKMTKYEK